MTNVLQTAADWLATMRQSQQAADVAYHRGAASVDIVASPTPVQYEQQDAGGAIITAQRWDWVVRREDLVFGGVETEPAEGDLIVRTVGTRTETFEVIPAGTAAHAEPLDADAKYWTVHTKLISVA